MAQLKGGTTIAGFSAWHYGNLRIQSNGGDVTHLTPVTFTQDTTGTNLTLSGDLDVTGTTILGNNLVVGAGGIGGTFGNGAAIALGDNDTGIRQNGDGVLELWTNNQSRVTLSTSVFNVAHTGVQLQEHGSRVWTAATLNPSDYVTNATLLDGNSKINTALLPDLAVNDVFPVASEAAMLALTAQRGDMAIRSDINSTFVLSTDSPGTLADWLSINTPTDGIAQINGYTTATVTLDYGDFAGAQAIQLNNETAVKGKRQDASYGNLLRMTTGDSVVLGNWADQTTINSVDVPVWSFSGGGYDLMHTGGGQKIDGSLWLNGILKFGDTGDGTNVDFLAFDDATNTYSFYADTSTATPVHKAILQAREFVGYDGGDDLYFGLGGDNANYHAADLRFNGGNAVLYIDDAQLANGFAVRSHTGAAGFVNVFSVTHAGVGYLGSNEIWHAGNFDPASIDLSGYLSLANGGTIDGAVHFHNSVYATTINVEYGEANKGQISYAPSTDSMVIAGQTTTKLQLGGAGSDIIIANDAYIEAGHDLTFRWSSSDVASIIGQSYGILISGDVQINGALSATTLSMDNVELSNISSTGTSLDLIGNNDTTQLQITDDGLGGSWTKFYVDNGVSNQLQMDLNSSGNGINVAQWVGIYGDTNFDSVNNTPGFYLQHRSPVTSYFDSFLEIGNKSTSGEVRGTFVDLGKSAAHTTGSTDFAVGTTDVAQSGFIIHAKATSDGSSSVGHLGFFGANPVTQPAATDLETLGTALGTLGLVDVTGADFSIGATIAELDISGTLPDLNTVIDSGFYRLGNGHANSPSGSANGQMIVAHAGLDTILQIVSNYTGKMWFRNGNPPDVEGVGTWSSWREVLHSEGGQTIDGNFNVNGTVTLGNGDLLDAGIVRAHYGIDNQAQATGNASYWLSADGATKGTLFWDRSDGYVKLDVGGSVYTFTNDSRFLIDGSELTGGSGSVAIQGQNDLTTRIDTGFYQSSTATLAEGWPLDDNGWMYVMSMTHDNANNYYALQLAGDFNLQKFWLRNTNNDGTTAWSEVVTMDSGAKVKLNDKEAFSAYDAWLRVNGAGDFSNGVYFGTSVIRTDNYFQVGSTSSYRWLSDGSLTTAGITTSGPVHIDLGGDATATSTTHPLTIGPYASLNLAIDGNEIMARNNGTVATLYLQNDGGEVSIGNASAATLTMKGSSTFSQGILDVQMDASGLSISNTASGLNTLQIYQPTANGDAVMAFHVDQDYAGYFGVGGAEQDLIWAGWSVGARRRILHSGNLDTTLSKHTPQYNEYLGSSANLNNYTTPGFYHQSSNANASAGSNYPMGHAGSMIVMQAAGSTQLYFTYNGSSRAFMRNSYNSWSSWKEFAFTGTDVSFSQIVADRVECGYDHNISGSIGCSSWFRSSGATGWYNGTYNGGIYMTDTTYVRVYNSKSLYVAGSGVFTGNVTAYYSDERLKDIEEELDAKKALSSVRRWRKVLYTANDLAAELGNYDTSKREIGLIAGEIEEDYPELTPLAPFDMEVGEKDGVVTSKTGLNYKTLDYSRVGAVQAAAITALADQVDEQAETIAKLTEKLTKLEELLNAK